MAFVDHYLSQVRALPEPVGEELLDLIACALGAHLGEVIIRKVGGRWRGPLPQEVDEGTVGREARSAAVIDEEHPANWRVELAPVPLSFAPVGMAAEAIRHAEVEGYYAGFTTLPAFAEELAEALGRVPVSTDYYYSLTGRMETLLYAVEILADMQRQEREADEEGDAEVGADA